MGSATAPHRRPTCCSVEHSESVENYLKALYQLAGEGDVITTSGVSVRLGVSAPSVSAMVARLTEAGLIGRDGGGRLALTDHGLRHAQAVVRRHRLLETFLFTALAVPWDEVHDEAEVLEHAVSERLTDRIAAALGDPRYDPHGDPIPPKDGEHVECWPGPLSSVAPGERFRVERISDRDSEALRYFGELGIRPGVVLVVTQRDPFGGPLWVTVDGESLALGDQLVGKVHGTVEERAQR
jgi:DtxR family Mn-dependent transcriptional regulator